MRRIAALAATAALVASATAADAQAPDEPKAAAAANAQVVLDWNATAVTTLLASGKSQPESMVYIALAQAAVYDAVVAIEGGYRRYLVVPGVPPGASPEAAAAAAAYGVLTAYFPDQKTALDEAYATSLGAIPDGPAEDRGVLVGQQVAAGLVAARTDDGRGAPGTYTPTPAPGVWRPTPPAYAPASTPWLAKMRPLLLKSADQLRPGPPPALGTPRYRRDLEETRRFGAKLGSLRTAEQTETARFWTEPVHQQHTRALRTLVTREQLDLRDAARALALGTTAMADSLIACFDAKYHYGAWRPVTAIQELDPAWEPLGTTPNHPEYPSTHSCTTAALGRAAAEVVGSDQIELDVASTVTGTTRRFATVRDLQRDIVDARVFAGFHWRTSDQVGVRLGDHVTRWALNRHFRPVAG